MEVIDLTTEIVTIDLTSDNKLDANTAMWSLFEPCAKREFPDESYFTPIKQKKPKAECPKAPRKHKPRYDYVSSDDDNEFESNFYFEEKARTILGLSKLGLNMPMRDLPREVLDLLPWRGEGDVWWFGNGGVIPK